LLSCSSHQQTLIDHSHLEASTCPRNRSAPPSCQNIKTGALKAGRRVCKHELRPQQSSAWRQTMSWWPIRTGRLTLERKFDSAIYVRWGRTESEVVKAKRLRLAQHKATRIQSFQPRRASTGRRVCSKLKAIRITIRCNRTPEDESCHRHVPSKVTCNCDSCAPHKLLSQRLSAR